MTEKNGKIINYDFGTHEPQPRGAENLTTAELISELLRRGEHEIVLRQPQSAVAPKDESARAFQTAVELDREMERSVLYRVFIAIELIGLILLLRTIAIHFI